jgi:hypothetical protein
MTDCISTISAFLTAVGTIALAAFTGALVVANALVVLIAVFGDQIRARFLGPRLTVGLTKYEGELVRTDMGAREIYYHLNVENHGQSAAMNARILCYKVERRLRDGSFREERLAAPAQLLWRFSDVSGFRTIPAQMVAPCAAVCDLAHVAENGTKLSLCVVSTESFPGHLARNDTIRVTLAASADNYQMPNACTLEIFWDGEWREGPEDMEKHLTLRVV